MHRFQTRAVHAGRDDFNKLCVHAPPLDLSTTYPIADLDVGSASFDALIGGAATAANPIYARLHNPTVARAEKGIALLEGAEACVAYASGMAALTALLMDRAQHGKHVLVVRPLYGTSDHLLESGICGMQAEFITDAGQIASHLRPDTALVMIETPSNPTLNLIDIRAAVVAAGKVPVAVDSTFATPVLQRPIELGATYVWHSATKFLGGHGDVIAGVVCCSEDNAHPLRTMRAATGALLHPLAAYLLHRGLPTLKLRVEAAQANAMVLAQRLVDHPAVAKVHYPGLPGAPNGHLIGTQMSGPGSLMSFEMKGGHDAAAQMMAKVKVMTSAVSLGSIDSLIQHPAGLTHRMVPEDVKLATGITPGLLRFSVGLEDVEDLWEDLLQAMG